MKPNSAESLKKMRMWISTWQRGWFILFREKKKS